MNKPTSARSPHNHKMVIDHFARMVDDDNSAEHHFDFSQSLLDSDYFRDTQAILSTPHLSAPQLSAPQLSAPQLSAPQLSAPHLSAPHLSAPHLSAPHLSAPHHSAPHLSAPHLSAPHLSAPQLSGPQIAPSHISATQFHQAHHQQERENEDPNQIALHFQSYQPDSSLSFDPIPNHQQSLAEPLQVDHNGSKVAQILSSPWLASSVAPDIPAAVSETTSCQQQDTVDDSSQSASVAAAAVTAAMIMIRDDAVSKRPRTQSVQSFEKRDDYEDDVTEASIQDSEDPCSPRGISVILKDALDTRLKAIKRKEAHAVSASLSASVSLAKARKPSLSDKQITPVLSESDHGDVCRKRRAEAMERFRRKKAVRCFGRRVRYQIRKRIATTRPRVNGRFAKRCDAERHMQAKMMKSE